MKNYSIFKYCNILIYVYFRLVNLNAIEKFFKKVDTDDEDNSDDTNITPTKNTKLKVSPKRSKSEINKLEKINQFLSTLDETYSGIYKLINIYKELLLYFYLICNNLRFFNLQLILLNILLFFNLFSLLIYCSYIICYI